jgi:transketolase
VNHFGASAPGNVLMRHYGFTVDDVYARAMKLINLRG